MASDEEKAIDNLYTLIEDTAKGLAEETEVYKKAEEIVNNNKYLFGAVNSILQKKFGASLNINDTTKIDFSINPEKEQGSVNLTMPFEEGGKIGYDTGDIVQEVANIDEATIGDAIAEYTKKLKKTKVDPKRLKSNVNELNNITAFLRNHNLLDTPIINFQDKNFVDKFWLQMQDIADLSLEEGQKSFFVSKGKIIESKSRTLHSKLGTAMSKISGWDRKSWDNILSVQPTDLDSGFFSKSTRVGFDFGDKGMNQIIRSIKNIKNPQARNLAIIKVFTGIRTTDLKELTLNQIDLDRRILEYIGGKKGQATVGKPQQISDIVATAIRDQISLSGVNDPDSIIFKNADSLEKMAIKDMRESIANLNKGDGKIFTQKKWNYNLGKIDKTPIDFNFKMLRNAVAKTALAEGATYNEIATVLGHFKGSDVTAQYYATTSVRAVPDLKPFTLMSQIESNYLQFAGYKSPQDYGKSIGLVNTLGLSDRYVFPSEQIKFRQKIEGVSPSQSTKGFTVDELKKGKPTESDIEQRLTDIEAESARLKEEVGKTSGTTNKNRANRIKSNVNKVLKNLGINKFELNDVVTKKTLKSLTPWLLAPFAGAAVMTPKIAEATLDVALSSSPTGSGTVKDEVKRLISGGLSEQEAINEYKLQQQKNPLYESERDVRFGKNIETYETNFMEKQKREEEKEEYEKKHKKDVEKIWTKGLFSDIKEQYTKPDEQGFM